MSNSNQENFRVAEEAAAWLLRLQHEDTPAVRAEFSSWVRKGAANLQEFLFAQAIWQELDHIDPAVATRLSSLTDGSDDTVIDLATAKPASTTKRSDHTERQPSVIDTDAALSHRNLECGSMPAALDTETSAIALHSVAATSDTGQRASRWPVRLAACVAALAVAWLGITLLPDRAQTYATALGDQKAIKLNDGSVIHLNTGTKVEVRYSRSQRSIKLLEGEALFTVEKDPARPFVVTTDSAAVRAVGTQFNVYRNRHHTTEVAVLHGIVQVAETAAPINAPGNARSDTDSVRLVAGDEARIDGQGHIRKTTTPNVQRAVAWRERRLVFPGDPIADIADEFNRYNRIPIRVEGETIRQRRMSGVFDADDPAPLIRFLANDPDVTVVRTEHETLIRPRT